MQRPAIHVEHVFKKFRRGQRVDSIRDWFGGRARARLQSSSLSEAEFWVLHDVSFDVSPGEAFGIIGPNGAGKSTFLKLLAGIIRQDRGVIEVRGPVSPLIELGAGFHPDLTGRENIFLNASILGLSRRDVRRRFEEIVDFAGVREFLDTPVKRYSSGMHARLGFSIAAHVEPRVMLVDEVLSVGDRVFRAKCMDKMQSFLHQGVAVVFVSHDLASVGRFCRRALLLAQGRAAFIGTATEAVARYHQACVETVLVPGARLDPPVRVMNAQLQDAAGATVSSVSAGERVNFQFEVTFARQMTSPSYGFAVIRTEDHFVLFETSSSRLGLAQESARPGEHRRVRYWFEANLPPGEYAIGFHVRERDGLQYAAEDAYATRFIVDGAVNSGGCVHMAPSVEVAAMTGVPTVERFAASREMVSVGAGTC